MTDALDVPKLDDLRFQNLVDEARKRIITYCPEWTDYNISDPGITLIELFAWMTDLLGYRLNQVPVKNYLKFLELIGTNRKPPEQAKTELTFYLSAPFPRTRANGDPDYDIETTIPVDTEVATRRSTGDDKEIIFTTDEEMVIVPPRLIHVRRDVENNFDRNYLQPQQKGDEIYYNFDLRGMLAFQQNPQDGDMFYLGFGEDQNPAGYFIQFDFKCDRAHGTGVNPESPPRVWECFDGNEWVELKPEEDTTKGLNVDGNVNLHLPLKMTRTDVHGISTYWIRCQMLIRDEIQGRYNSSPFIKDIKAYVLGATVAASHSAPLPGEKLGDSNGDSAQRYFLSNVPILPLDPTRGEFIQVEEEAPDGSMRFENWTVVPDFSESTRYDKHLTLDISTGEINFGPTVRQSDGSAKQYGAVPKLDRRIRITKYRMGGGANGNVPRGSLRVLKRSVSYIVDVTNRKPAGDGKDVETIESARVRTQRTLRTQNRAVVAEDYEYFCGRLDYVQRVVCKQSDSDPARLRPGVVRLYIVPTPTEKELELDGSITTSAEKKAKRKKLAELQAPYKSLARLHIDDPLRDQLKRDLDRHRVLGIVLEVNEPTYYGIRLEAQIQSERFRTSKDVHKNVVKALKDFLTPLAPIDKREAAMAKAQESGIAAGQTPPGIWEWTYGRSLFMSDLYAELQDVSGVEHITQIKLWWCRITPEQAGKMALALETNVTMIEAEEIAGIEWKYADDGVVQVSDDALVTLLDYSNISVSVKDL